MINNAINLKIIKIKPIYAKLYFFIIKTVFYGFVLGSGKIFANLSKDPLGTTILPAWAF